MNSTHDVDTLEISLSAIWPSTLGFKWTMLIESSFCIISLCGRGIIIPISNFKT